MRVNFKKTICLALAALTVLGASGCGESGGGGTTANLEDLYIPTYVDNGQRHRTMASLPPNMADENQVAIYKASGMNAVPYTEDFFSAEDVLLRGENSTYMQGLKLCEEYGIDAFIRPHSSFTSALPTEEPCYYEQYFSNIDFRDYPAVKGFFVVDEPEYAQLLDLESRYLTWFNENYGGEGYEFFSNLFSRYVTNFKKGDYVSKTYDDYAEKYLSILDRAEASNKHFSIDYYALRKTDGGVYMADTNLMTHADAAIRAKAHGMGMGAYVQVFGGYADGQSYRMPTTFAEVDWGVNNLLSFGATTLKFFHYREYKKDKLLGMLTEGEPNERYYWTQQALETLRKWDHVILSFEWEHIYTNVGTGSRDATNPAFEYVRSIAKPITNVEKVQSKYDITMNEFKDADGNKAFMLCNYDEPLLQRKNKTTVTFKDEVQGVLYYRNGEPTTALLNGGKFEIELNAGEGVFVIPLYKK